MNDPLDNLFAGDTGPVRVEPIKPVEPFKPAVQRFEEGCPKCGGRGKFVSYSGRVVGDCFACKGAGKKIFKTSAATRAANRENAAERKAQATAADIAAFQAREPEVFDWLNAETQKAKPFEFAIKMIEAIAQWGDLTDGQLAACKRLAHAARERAAERASAVASAPSVDSAGIDRLKASFDTAIAYSAAKGLKLSPRITIDGMTIAPAKAHSANPGALYVKAGQAYLGKITGGKFFAARECTKEDETKVLAFVANPAEAAKVYGQTTGTCCVCNATLRSEWKLRGIGPICAEKFGWA
jgi:hypothetical protein